MPIIMPNRTGHDRIGVIWDNQGNEYTNERYMNIIMPLTSYLCLLFQTVPSYILAFLPTSLKLLSRLFKMRKQETNQLNLGPHVGKVQHKGPKSHTQFHHFCPATRLQNHHLAAYNIITMAAIPHLGAEVTNLLNTNISGSCALGNSSQLFQHNGASHKARLEFLLRLSINSSNRKQHRSYYRHLPIYSSISLPSRRISLSRQHETDSNTTLLFFSTYPVHSGLWI